MPQKHTKTIILAAVLLLLILPATAVVPSGRISVHSTPEAANVCIDNNNCDITPAIFTVEGNAWHVVLVTATGYQDWTESVYVTSDQLSDVNAYLDQDLASTGIQVSVTPGGGTICLDNGQCRENVGTIYGTGSTLFTGVSPGYHTISVESPAGYMDTTNLVQVNQGKITNVNIALEVITGTPPPTKTPTPNLAPGTITVHSTPEAANVCIDKNNCETTPAIFTVEGNAWHVVVVTATGYRDYTESVYVTSDQTSNVNAYLDQDLATTGIRVSVTPGGGTVCLDNGQCRENMGTINGTGSTLYTGLSPGYHTISVESPVGYVDTTNLVQVNLGKITDVNITLDKFIVQPTTTISPITATGMVRVNVDRTGSTICIDNTRCVYNVGGSPGTGAGTTFYNNVTVDKTHTVTVAAEGYEPFSATVSVTKDVIAKVDVSLQPIGKGTTVRTITSQPGGTIPATTKLVTTIPATTKQVTTIKTQAGVDVVPFFGILAMCGIVLLFRKNRK
jgi:hypothetical protein